MIRGKNNSCQKMTPVRLLLCGSNYAKAYLAAIDGEPRDYLLAGLLSRGSPRSRELAVERRIPLYHRVSDVPDGIDVVCAAMGSAGQAPVLELLERRISVLCEHPHAPAYLKAALKRAASCDARFHINGHFAQLDGPLEFVRAARARQGPQWIDVTLQDRALYGALEIVRCATGSCEPSDFRVMPVDASFPVLEGRLGGVPAKLQIESSWMANGELLPDGSPDYLLDCRIVLGYSSGVLTLLSLSGPVLWNANVLLQPSVEIEQQRIRANRQSLDALVGHMRGGPPPELQSADHILDVSAAWESLGRLLRNRPS